MARRSRKVSVYDAVQHHVYGDEEAFFQADVVPGLHSFNFGRDDLISDVLYEEHPDDREDVLLVFFSAAIASDATFPFFGGRSIAQRVGVPLLTFSDPSVRLSASSGTNFYLGTTHVDYSAFILQAVEKFRRGRELIFAGPSAGGFAALRFGNEYPDSISLAVNPTTNLLTQPLFYRHAYPINFPGVDLGDLAAERVMSVESANNHVVFAQNIHDDEYVGSQLAYYWHNGVDTDRVSLVAKNWGLGHAAMPSDEFSEMLSQIVGLIDRPEDVTKEIGVQAKTLSEALVALHEMKYEA